MDFGPYAILYSIMRKCTFGKDEVASSNLASSSN